MHTFMPPMLTVRRLLGRLLSSSMLFALPPLTPQPPAPPPQPQGAGRRDYFIGLGVGLIPLVLAMVGLGGLIFGARAGVDTSVYSILLAAGGILYVLEIVSMAFLFPSQRTRQAGFGVLTMVAVSPVVFFVGCIAILATPQF